MPIADVLVRDTAPGHGPREGICHGCGRITSSWKGYWLWIHSASIAYQCGTIRQYVFVVEQGALFETVPGLTPWSEQVHAAICERSYKMVNSRR